MLKSARSSQPEFQHTCSSFRTRLLKLRSQCKRHTFCTSPVARVFNPCPATWTVWHSAFGTDMLLKTTHQTHLTYSDFISESVMELRVAPRQEQDQHRLSFDLALGPQASVTSYFDWLGNTVHAFTVNDFHGRIEIVATSVVETDRPPMLI